MKIIGPIIALALSITAASAQVSIAWDDNNAPEAFVTLYRVYVVGPSSNSLYRSIGIPQVHPYPYSATTGITTAEAGKVMGVVAVNSGGLESEPPMATVKIPPLPIAPTEVGLSFNFKALTMEILWTNPNPAEAVISGYRLYQKNDTKWDKILEITNATTRATIPIPTGTKTFSVSSVNLWGESPMSAPAEVPVLILPVSNLRVITTK